MSATHSIPFAALDGLSLEAVEQVLLSVNGLSVAQVNWPDAYPYAPETTVRLAHSDTTLYLRYDVRGKQLRAKAGKDFEPVWCDSCVEFFCQVTGDTRYMNFETNCIGTLVASRRKGRDLDVCLLSEDEMRSIRRRSSLPHAVFEEKDGCFTWTIVLAIPLAILTEGKAPMFPLTLKANFYKCADETRFPHFVSWQPIGLPQPDFHCPQFFGTLILEA